MNDYAPSSYQAPYRYSSGCEPDGGSCNDLTIQAQKTPELCRPSVKSVMFII
ncbi:MAG: hypothetical protein KCCBMMGE_02104 [Candidatus Methanoperedenaceae archaeon GB37]|nr:MAG: hypothetical protein KCCBMMGE_02104 [Candidatus Methanoperedenaceae archaeon GB37]